MLGCRLDQQGCLDLLSVLRTVNQISQEQAWAVCYELAALMQRLAPANCAPIESLAQIQLHRDGYVHENTCSLGAPGPAAPAASTTTAAEPAPTTETPAAAPEPDPGASPVEKTHLQVELPQPPPPPPPHCHQQQTQYQQSQQSQQSQQTQQQQQPQQQQQQQQPQQQQPQQQQQPHKQRVAQPQQQILPSPPITPELNCDDQPTVGRRKPALDESELVASLGIALFWALDYGIADDEERKLHLAMEYLIIQAQNGLTLEQVLGLCTTRLPVATKAHADAHYRQACKTLVADTLELSMFLHKIYTASMVLSDISTLSESCATSQRRLAAVAKPYHMEDSEGPHSDLHHHHHHHHHHHLHHHHHHHDVDALSQLGEPLASLRALGINDWARLWMRVIRELRQRGRFKQALAVN